MREGEAELERDESQKKVLKELHEAAKI